MLTMFTLNWKPGFQHKLVMVNSNKRVNRTISLFVTLFEIVLQLNTCSPSHNWYIIPNRLQAVMFCHAIRWNDHMRLGSFSQLRDNIVTSKGLLAVDRTQKRFAAFSHPLPFPLSPKSPLVVVTFFYTLILQIYRSPLCYDSPVFSSSRLSWSGPFLSRPHWNSSRQAFDARGTGNMVGCGCNLAHNRKSSTKWREQLGTVLLNNKCFVSLLLKES